MAEWRNRVGCAYSLTVIAPVIAGREAAAREAIAAWAVGADSPLARLRDLHFSRIHVVSDVVFQGPAQKHREHLRASQLVFTSTFDGRELAPYLEALRTRAEPDTWWRHCVGYPGSEDPGAFARFVRDHQVDSSLFASAHPQARVPHVLESLALRERIIDFAIEAHGLDAGDLQRRFRATFA
jgi:hypothetical protein